MIRSLSDLTLADTFYVDKNVYLVFKKNPSLQTIEELRKFLDSLTDELIKEKLNEKDMGKY